MVSTNRIIFCTEPPDGKRQIESRTGTSVEVYEAVRRYLTDPLVTRLELEKEAEPVPPLAA